MMNLWQAIVFVFAWFGSLGAAVIAYEWIRDWKRRREWGIVMRHARGFDDRVKAFEQKAGKK